MNMVARTGPDKMSSNTGMWSAAAAALPTASLALAYASSVWFEQVGRIGPLDRAKLGWLVTVPLVVIAPGLAAVALSVAARGRALIAVGAVSLASLIFTLWRLASTETRIGCYVVESAWEVVPNAALVGLAAGLGLFAATVVASRLSQSTKWHPLLTAFAVGTGLGILGGTVTLYVFSVAFPAVSCAPPL